MTQRLVKILTLRVFDYRLRTLIHHFVIICIYLQACYIFMVFMNSHRHLAVVRLFWDKNGDAVI